MDKNEEQTAIRESNEKEEALKEEQEEEKKEERKFRLTAIWIAITGLLGFILNQFGLFAKLGLTSDTWNTLISLISALLAAFGIIAAPRRK